MYFVKRKIGNNIYVYLVEGVYNREKKTVTNRTVKSYGRYDKLPEDFKKTLDNEEAKRELANRLTQQKRDFDIAEVTKAIQERQACTTPEQNDLALINFNRTFALHYGHLALKRIWEEELGLKYKIGYLQDHKTDVKTWEINDLLFYLCSLKLIDPKSYLGAYQSKSNFIYCPWHNVVQDNFYWALDFVYEHREALIEHAVSHYLGNNKKEVKVAFFDCTNTWFETPYDDLTWQIIRFTRKQSKKLRKQGFSEESIEAYLDSEEFASELSEELEVRKDDILRMRGKSKEGRFAQPIVTVALAIDQTGFPIDCKVYAGNLSEIHTVRANA